MSLKEKLMEDLKTSMREKDKIRKNTITLVRADIKQIEVDDRREVNDEDVIGIISKQYKQRQNSLDDFKKGGRDDLVQSTEEEMDILMKYLPEQLSEEDVEQIVKDTIKELDASSMKDMGSVMQAVMPKIKGKADGNIVSNMVKQQLI